MPSLRLLNVCSERVSSLSPQPPGHGGSNLPPLLQAGCRKEVKNKPEDTLQPEATVPSALNCKKGRQASLLGTPLSSQLAGTLVG